MRQCEHQLVLSVGLDSVKCMQGTSENQEVASKVSAAVAYHLLNACSADKQAKVAMWLAKLDLPLLQPTLPQPGTTIKVPFLTSHVYMLASQVLCNACKRYKLSQPVCQTN